jgi:pimeloyl-ACP methyl ester carboxylesterase
MARRPSRLNRVICVALLATAAAVGCQNAPAQQNGIDVPAGAKLPGDFGGSGPGTLVSANLLQNLDIELRDAASLAARITYTSTTGITNQPATVTGAVFVPWGQAPKGGWPTVALGHPTTGIQPECAPSLSPNMWGSSATIAGLLQAGYAVTVPDYQGLGTDKGYHPYLDSTTVGLNLIDSVRAARKLVREISLRWVGLGYDQGGQAAWAANELTAEFGGGLQQLGSISVSPFSDVDGLADAAAAGTLTTEQKLLLVQYLAALKQQYPEIDLDEFRRGIVQQQWDVLVACRKSMLQQREAVAKQITADDLRPATPDAVDTLRGYLRKTSLPQGVAGAPMWVIYGGKDPVISSQWTDRAIERACTLGDTVQVEFQTDARPEIDLARAIDWINARRDDAPPANDCAGFIARLQGQEPPAEAPPTEEPTTEEPPTEEPTPEESGGEASGSEDSGSADLTADETAVPTSEEPTGQQHLPQQQQPFPQQPTGEPHLSAPMPAEVGG